MSENDVESIRYLPQLGESDQNQVFDSIRVAHELVIELDRLLYKYALALEAAQPPAQGKISIRFLKRRRENSETREPVFVQWFKTTDGKWLYNRLKPGEIIIKMKRYWIFAATMDDTKELLTQARFLHQQRASILLSLYNTKRKHAVQNAKARSAIEPYLDHLDGVIPALSKRREEIIQAHRARKLASADWLAAVPSIDSSSMPRVHPKGRTRGFKDKPEPV